MTRYLARNVNEDGGWGLHLGGHSTVFATALYYVVLRMLGMDKRHPLATQARDRLLSLGEWTRGVKMETTGERLLNPARWCDWSSSMG
jgi:hypothetical protein